jgi:RNA polymerase sigma-70 factor (ECF subfamily)
MTDDTRETEELLRRAKAGDGRAQAELFEHYRLRLRQMVRLRLDRRLHGCIDPSDVLQETFLDLATRFHEYAKQPAAPFFLWRRGLRLTHSGWTAGRWRSSHVRIRFRA